MSGSTIQISLRLPSDWHKELKDLARFASAKHKKDISVQELIREAISFSYEKLVQYSK